MSASSERSVLPSVSTTHPIAVSEIFTNRRIYAERTGGEAIVESERMARAASRSLVLVVEDEPLLRMDAVDMIRESGFDVLEASNADEAILMLETRLDIELVFTDIDMPGSVNGIKLAHAVRNRWPPIRIVATSGHFALHDGDLPPDVSLSFQIIYTLTH